MIDVQQDLERLITILFQQLHRYEIPASHQANFEKFLKEYGQYEKFFKDITETELDILKYFKENSLSNREEPQNFSKLDVIKFLNGGIVIKEFTERTKALKMGENINNVVSKFTEKIDNKMLHFSVPLISQLVNEQSDLILGLAKKFLNFSNELSFEVGYFKISPGISTGYWHDDYSLFCNKFSKEGFQERLLLNFHIALSDVYETSSPVSFIKGSEKIVYARPAIKFFKDRKIEFEVDSFLKATYLTENLYVPGEEIKANFIGMIPSLYYRLYQCRNSHQKYDIFYNILKAGEMQIFSPHLLHTAPFKNIDNKPRESLVLRFFAGSSYNYRNTITVRDLIRNLSVSKSRDVGLDEVKSFFFKDYKKVEYDSYLYFNVFIKKEQRNKDSNILRVYLDNLVNFFNSR